MSFMNVDIKTNSKQIEKFYDDQLTYTGGAIKSLVNGSTTDYYIQFNSSGTLTIPNSITCDILIVGGGGGGGVGGGGGGAGAVLYTTNFNLPSGTHSIIVGGGGDGSKGTSTNGTNGNNSSITINGTTYIAVGGGGGGTRNDPVSYTGRGGNNGGSGGGGSHSDNSITANVGGSSTKNIYTSWISLGNAGGDGKDGYANGYGSGGGGGAGSIGTIAGTNSGGNGGSGVNLSSIFGSSVGHSGWFGGGGGGGSWTGTNGHVGYGNGGNGLLGGGGNAYGGNGIANTGGGGGGANFGTSSSGSGGSGVVIIRHKISQSMISIDNIDDGNLLRDSNDKIFFEYINVYDSSIDVNLQSNVELVTKDGIKGIPTLNPTNYDENRYTNGIFNNKNDIGEYLMVVFKEPIILKKIIFVSKNGTERKNAPASYDIYNIENRDFHIIESYIATSENYEATTNKLNNTYIKLLENNTAHKIYFIVFKSVLGGSKLDYSNIILYKGQIPEVISTAGLSIQKKLK